MSDIQKINLTIEQGATFRYKFAWVDTKKRAINLTGYTARMQIRATVEDVAILAELTTSNGGLVVSEISGIVSLLMSDTQTSAFNWTKGVYDIELISPNSEVYRMVSGSVTVSKEVTR
ncbi:hypothetical protein UFOVP26_109 [uncultured Caudovirales phage]|uniref:BppU N-terminal domain-containing protein n=1 Tax=uncultured Caudovirales phage TaxID=2100421 RepID=A0A6J7WNQ2_9CAUD|nr:hypothetical protein UFOVP26_109 [uncultured Caudovirales phage]CAB4124014.1 hypothetical protein UFOVP44_126 [uncultured Caudovirales phage]CAB5219659.1 hypothetical protein UFOVP220_117 [uncultured Caudovirales phage]